ncbi:hypothetical protein B0J11DRAFT_537093 [Dendryphion nanum]|uniref:Uncharacterized protein n=1 Tax=Dendryphion nanum TaxID=256645 RepID=A0A9P9DEJ3_9PLEO|nr:hypothetical protein B0J11DRAFT_537093 [Dendryphion nanum]
MENDAVTPRRSKFREATMNSVNSIHAPPDVFWTQLGIEDLINEANKESVCTGYETTATIGVITAQGAQERAASESSSSKAVNPPQTPGPNNEASIFGRLRSIWRSSTSTFSGLGKRKAGEKDAVNPNKNKQDAEKGNASKHSRKSSDKENRREFDSVNITPGPYSHDNKSELPLLAPDQYASKEEYAQLYADAKSKGLLPKPQVFARPRATPRKSTGGIANRDIATANSTPRTSSAPTPSRITPALRQSASKKDLAKQMKLSKRVSDLEQRLAAARKQLSAVIGDDAPPVPALPTLPSLPPTPNTMNSTKTQSFHQEAQSPTANKIESSPKPSAGKIIKKRKVSNASESDYKPIPTESDYESDFSSEPIAKKTRRSGTKKSSRLSKRRSVVARESVVMIVPDGASVPPIPSIPSGIKGKRAQVGEENNDGFGGYGHEIF